MVRSLLRCFCAPTLLSRSRVVPDTLWNDDRWRASHFVSWGRGVDFAHLQVSFEIPTRAHLNCAAAIFRKFALAPLIGLVDIAKGVSAVEEDDLSE